MHHCHHPHLQFKQLQHDRPLQFHLPTDPPRCCLEAKHLHQYLSMVSAWGRCADHTYTSAYTSAVLRSEVFNHCQARRLAASSTGINESLPASPQELVAALGWVSPSGHIKLSVVFLICPSRDIGLRYTYSSETERERETVAVNSSEVMECGTCAIHWESALEYLASKPHTQRAHWQWYHLHYCANVRTRGCCTTEDRRSFLNLKLRNVLTLKCPQIMERTDHHHHHHAFRAFT